MCARKLAGGCVERLGGLAAALVELREGIVLPLARALRLATLANLLDASLDAIDEFLVFIRVGHELGGAGNTKVGDGIRIAVLHGGGREEVRVLRTAGATEAHGLAAGVHIHGIEHGCGDGVTAALENRREVRVLRTAGATEAHGLAAGVHIHGIEHGCGDGVTAALENRRCIG